jgi:hypothetical protein
MAKKKIDLTPLKEFVIQKGEKVGIAIALAALLGISAFGFMQVGAFSSDKHGRPYAAGLEQDSQEFNARLQRGAGAPPTKVPEGSPQQWAMLPSSHEQRPLFLLPEVVVNKRNTPFMAGLSSKDVRWEYLAAGVLRYDQPVSPGRKDFGVYGDGKEVKEAKDASIDFAYNMEPRRMVVVQTTFPIRAQIEEFRLAFLLETQQAVLKNPKDRPSFLGMIVHRKESPSGDWELLYHYKPELMPKDVREFLRDCILDEMNPKTYQAAIYPGLVTPLPRLANASYAPINIDSIARIAETPTGAKTEVKVEKKDDKKEVPPRDITYVPFDKLPKRFQQQYENFNPLDPLGLPFEQTPFRGPDLSKYATAPVAKEGTKTNAEGEEKPIDLSDIPDALVRFIDPTVKPNRTYVYKIEVRLRNPNFGRPNEVNFPQLAQVAELRARKNEQEVVTPEITIPDEYTYLASDMQPMANYARGADFLSPRNDQVPIHIQKYVEMTVLSSGPKAVADWAICERLLHRRGDVIGAPVRHLAKDPAKDPEPLSVWTDIPVWDKRRKTFVLEQEAVPNTFYRGAFGVKIEAGGIPLDFGLKWLADSPPESLIWTKSPLFGDSFEKNRINVIGKSPVLVDFDGGRRDKWTLSNGVSVTKDESGAEILVLNPDLSLTSRSARADYEEMESPDKPYRARVETWRARVRMFKPAGNGAGTPPPIKGILDR